MRPFHGTPRHSRSLALPQPSLQLRALTHSSAGAPLSAYACTPLEHEGTLCHPCILQALACSLHCQLLTASACAFSSATACSLSWSSAACACSLRSQPLASAELRVNRAALLTSCCLQCCRVRSHGAQDSREKGGRRQGHRPEKGWQEGRQEAVRRVLEDLHLQGLRALLPAIDMPNHRELLLLLLCYAPAHSAAALLLCCRPLSNQKHIKAVLSHPCRC